jgi:hypothetical protein
LPSSFHHGVYGISLRSEFPLALPKHSGSSFAEIQLRRGTPKKFADAIAGTQLTARGDWYQFAHLHDGSSYARWRGLGEFLVSADGERIFCARAPDAPMESFQVYLLGHALSFALVKAGFEPLHGTAIEHEGQAIAFLGESGFGKSTLAGSFIAAGCRLLTDDLLLLRPSVGTLIAYPGPPRIKLHPDSAGLHFGATGTGVPMNAETSKHVIPLGAAQRCRGPVPLRTIYVLASPDEMWRKRRVRFEPLVSRAAFFALVGNTFNRNIADSGRLKRQLTDTARVLRHVPVRKLYHPRSLARLPDIRAAILADSRVNQQGAD